MWIKDWWNRMMKKFKKEDSIPEAESVMELKPEDAPEPVPERKTSDEMIIEMAESARNDLSRTSEKSDDPEAAAQEEIPSEVEPGDPEEPEEPYDAEEPEEPYDVEEPEEPYDVEEPEEPYDVEEPDPAEDAAWLGAEDDEKEDADEEC